MCRKAAATSQLDYLPVLPPPFGFLTDPSLLRLGDSPRLHRFTTNEIKPDQIFIKAFPRGSDGRRGILESTGLVEVNDCLTAINGVPLDKSDSLHEVMASIRAAKSPLSLRFARYPPPRLRSPSSSSSSLFSASAVPALASPAGTDSLGGNGSGGSAHVSGARARAGTGDTEKREAADPELDDVLNSALVLGLGERVADIQKRNAQLLQEVDRIGRAAADKRQVRSVCTCYLKVIRERVAVLTCTAILPLAIWIVILARLELLKLFSTLCRPDSSRGRWFGSLRCIGDR